MKRLTLITLCLSMLLVGCGSRQSESSTATTVQYTANEDKESSNSSCDSIDEILKESYPWRKAYAEFLWDTKLFDAELELQFKNFTKADYEYYTPMLGFIFLDSDEIPELLVYYKSDAPPATEYYVIYHYAPATKEYSSSIVLYHSGYIIGNGDTKWKYLPHGNAFYTGYYKCMGGLYDYNLLFLENGEWVNWDDVPVITSRIIAENYGVFDNESINIHDLEPVFSDDWRTPELRDEGSLSHGVLRHHMIESMFGSDAVVGLPDDTL